MDDIYERHNWLVSHPEVFEEYAGRWVAIARKSVIATAASLKALMKKSARAGVEHPLVFQVPREDEDFHLHLH